MNNKILVADDSMENRMFIELILSKNAYSFKIAANGIEALEFFQQEKFDLVITDLYMPNLNGIQLLHEIRKTNKNIPVVAFTGAEFDDNDPDMMNLGFKIIFRKPFSENDFIDIVKKYLAAS